MRVVAPTMAAWQKLAGVSGAAAVGLGAYGAHGFKPKEEVYSKIFDTANKYHLMHSLLLATAPIAKRPNVVGSLCSVGIGLFSGSCYVAAVTENRQLGKLAPVG